MYEMASNLAVENGRTHGLENKTSRTKQIAIVIAKSVCGRFSSRSRSFSYVAKYKLSILRVSSSKINEFDTVQFN